MKLYFLYLKFLAEIAFGDNTASISLLFSNVCVYKNRNNLIATNIEL